MAGRTWMQQALAGHLWPEGGGAHWVQWNGIVLGWRELRAARRALVVQFGGAAGHAGVAWRSRSRPSPKALAAELKIGANPGIPWHAQRRPHSGSRDDPGLADRHPGKDRARTFSLMMQTEVGEAFEPAAPGRGGSSTMPQQSAIRSAVPSFWPRRTKVPALVSVMLAAMMQEHERGLGGLARRVGNAAGDLPCLQAARWTRRRESWKVCRSMRRALRPQPSAPPTGLIMAEAVFPRRWPPKLGT